MRTVGRCISLGLLACLACAIPMRVLAQAPVVSSQRLEPSTEDLESVPAGTPLEFGAAVAISGRTALVGMPVLGVPGRVAVFERRGDQWRRVATLLASDPDDLQFGTDVALDGTIAAVAALDETAARGVIYVFERRKRGWKQTARITGNIAPRVALDNATLATPTATSDGGGRVAIYERNRHGSWRRTAVVRASDGFEGDNFGQSIALEGRVLVVGAPGSLPDVELPGAAYVFVRHGNRWIEQAKLLSSDAFPGGQFGASVGINRRRIVVGAPTVDIPEDEFGIIDGAAYVFLPHRNTWAESQKLEGIAFNFGTFVAVGRHQVAIRVPRDTPVGLPSGRVFAFDWEGAVLTSGRELAVGVRTLGTDMDFSGRRLIIGTPSLPGSLSDPGSALVVEFGPVGGTQADTEPESED